MFLNKKIIRPDAVSLMMSLAYWIVLFWFATLLVTLIFTSQKFASLSEKFNMAYYSAESWIEQAIYEINLHNVGFEDSTKNYSWSLVNWVAIDDDWFISLLWSWSLQYSWEIDWMLDSASETWYIVYNWDLWFLKNDKNKVFYDSVRRIYFYYDNWVIWSWSSIINTCSTREIDIHFSFDATNPEHAWTNGESRIIYWRASWEDVLWWIWTWYVLQSAQKCITPDLDKTNPFCYSSWTWLSLWWDFDLSLDNHRWQCLDAVWTDCWIKKVVDFYNGFVNELYKPIMTFSYTNPLYESWNNSDYIPMKYVITNNNPTICKIPSLTIDIVSQWKVFWSIQEVRARLNQWSKWIDLDYAVIQ